MKKKEREEYSPESLKSEKERNRIAKELEPLMNKIVSQWEGRCPLDRELLEMQARYGIVYAMNNYRPGTTQTFFQYAGWCIRNWILNGINEFGSTVRIGATERKRLLDKGDTVYRTEYIDQLDEDSKEDRNLLGEIAKKVAYTEEYELFTREDVVDKLLKFVSKKFDKRHKDIFFRTYGLKGRKRMKGIDLAEKYHCTAALISQLNRDVLDSIRGNRELMVMLDTVRPSD